MYIGAERRGDSVYVWERHTPTKRVLKKYPIPHYFYVEDPEEGQYKSLYGHKCTKLEFETSKAMQVALQNCKRADLNTFESDIKPVHRVLSEKYHNSKTPKLNITHLDIEVDYDPNIGFAGVDNPYAPINSVALYHDWEDRTVVIAVPPETWGEEATWESQIDPTLKDLAEIYLVSDERELLLLLFHEIKNADILSGWNSQVFDMPYICKRTEIALGKSFLKRLSFEEGNIPFYSEIERFKKMHTVANCTNRIFLDYMLIFKKFEMEERHSYSLENISEELLDLPKLSYDGNLASLYREDFNFFMRYNIRDTECLKGFEDKLGYAKLAVDMFHSSTGVYNNVAGTIKLAELAIMNYCHYSLDLIVPDSPPPPELSEKAQGAYVLTPKAGFHEWIGSVDITSLYPSAIRTINISPETKIGQFTGKVNDYERFQKPECENEPAVIIMENKLTGEISTESKKIGEWKIWLKNNGYALSGYGTVFTQQFKGVIPSILEEWFAIRKKYKKLKADSSEQAKLIAKKVGDGYEQDEEWQKANALVEYYDRLQYCYKIKLNSTYGALLNRFFKYFDTDLGESTTGTGRAILKFMCGKTNEVLTGEFDEDGEAVKYGDTDSVAGNSTVNVNGINDTIENLFLFGNISVDESSGKQYSFPGDNQWKSPCYDNGQIVNKPVRAIYRHKVTKPRFRITTESGKEVIVTGDHSIMVERNGALCEITASEIRPDDLVITL